MENRITDLEIRLTHQESAIDEITRTLLQQEALIKKLQDELKNVRSQVNDVSNIAHASEEQPPPHY